ncbi:MAG: hypothetical protein ACE5E8_02370 [Acidimicrobiia bacterium]
MILAQQIDLPSFDFGQLVNIVTMIAGTLMAFGLIVRSARRGGNRIVRWMMTTPDEISQVQTAVSEMQQVLENGLVHRMERVESATAVLSTSVAELHGKVDTLISLDR